jgi:predicted amino acid dehydrogenase
VGHPRDRIDLLNSPGGRLVRAHSTDDDQFVAKMLTLPPTFAGDVTFGFDSIRGETLMVFRMPEQIMYADGRAEIDKAVQIAVGRGSSVIGLGALTAPATRGGQTLLSKVPAGVTITTGNALTAAVGRANVVEASEALGLGPDAEVAVVGCTGSVGVAASRLLDRAGYRLVLIGRSVTRVRKELADLLPRATVSGTLADAAGADVLLLLTGDPSAHVPPDLPKPGAVVLDLAHPANIPQSAYPDYAIRGVQVVAGGVVDIPGHYCALDMRLPDRNCALACLTETYLFAKAGIRKHSVGQATVSLALELEEIAADYGIRNRPLGLQSAVLAR